MDTNKVTCFCISFISLMLGIISFFLCIHFIDSDIHEKEKEAVSQYLLFIDRVYDDVHSSLAKLNRLNYSSCDMNHIVQMRTYVFESYFIKDIGYLNRQNELVCTTGMGKLEKTYKHIAPTVTKADGTELWMNYPAILFGKIQHTMIIQQGQYNIVLSLNKLSNELPVPVDFHWQLNYQFKNTFIPITSTSAFPEEGQYTRTLGLLDKQYHYQSCSEKTNYCIRIATHKSVLLAKYRLPIVLSISLSIFIVITSYLLISKLIRKQRSVKQRVIRGLTTGKFYPLYQPIVELKSQEVVGCEVLARFKDKYGDLTPDEFIPVLKRSRLTWEFTECLLKKVKQDFQGQGLPSKFKINVNVFPIDIYTGSIHGIDPILGELNNKHQVVIEITEDEALSEKRAHRELATLKAKGYCVAIDDFGTGYSNFGQISKLNCNTLKLDRSFVNDIHKLENIAKFLPNIIEIAKKIMADLVVEGIESNRQRKILMDYGVQFGQGWHFGKPMSFHELSTKI